MKNEFKDKRGIRCGFEASKDREPVHNNSKRLSQDEETGRTKGGPRNVAATMFMRGYEDANREKLEDRLTQWAKENDCLFTLNEIEQEFGEDIFTQIQKSTNGNSPSPGREAIVYRYDDGHLLKVVRYNVFSKNVLEFIDNRIALNNFLFTGTTYELIGICLRGKAGHFSFVLKQPHIKGTKPSQGDIEKEMVGNRGFTKIDETTYKKGDYVIEDLHTGNWIKGYNGKMYCIDPAPKLNYSRKYNNI